MNTENNKFEGFSIPKQLNELVHVPRIRVKPWPHSRKKRLALLRRKTFMDTITPFKIIGSETKLDPLTGFDFITTTSKTKIQGRWVISHNVEPVYGHSIGNGSLARLIG